MLKTINSTWTEKPNTIYLDSVKSFEVAGKWLKEAIVDNLLV